MTYAQGRHAETVQLRGRNALPLQKITCFPRKINPLAPGA
jgi:hypothetical protein